jgi:hypothetical protein
MMWGNCTGKIPIEISQAGNYQVIVKAYYVVDHPDGRMIDDVGRNFGPAMMTINAELIDINQEGKGNQLIKEKLVELHFNMLGEELSVDSEEIQFTYHLLVESWQARMSRGNLGNIDNWESEHEYCHYWNEELNAIDNWSSDPQGMLSAWRTVMTYLLSDPRYIHE